MLELDICLSLPSDYWYNTADTPYFYLTSEKRQNTTDTPYFGRICRIKLINHLIVLQVLTIHFQVSFWQLVPYSCLNSPHPSPPSNPFTHTPLSIPSTSSGTLLSSVWSSNSHPVTSRPPVGFLLPSHSFCFWPSPYFPSLPLDTMLI